MPSLQQPRGRVKCQTLLVSNSLFDLPGSDAGLILSTVCGRRACTALYRLNKIACEDLAYQLTKFAGERGTDPEAEGYAVNLTTRTCDCKGWLRHGTCKHLGSLVSLYGEGRLP
jgi:hypothetical protein